MNSISPTVLRPLALGALCLTSLPAHADSVVWSSSFSAPGTSEIAMCGDGWLWRLAETGDPNTRSLQYAAPPYYTSWVPAAPINGLATHLTCAAADWSIWYNRILWHTSESPSSPSRLESMWYYYPGYFYDYVLHNSPFAPSNDLDLASSDSVFRLLITPTRTTTYLLELPSTPGTGLGPGSGAYGVPVKQLAATTWQGRGVVFALFTDNTLWINRQGADGHWDFTLPYWERVEDPTFSWFGGMVADMDATVQNGQLQLWVLLSAGAGRTIHRVDYVP